MLLFWNEPRVATLARVCRLVGGGVAARGAAAAAAAAAMDVALSNGVSANGPPGGVVVGQGGSAAKAYDYLLKFLLVGDSDVGKGEILGGLEDGALESPF
ncbi:hypothetical protein MTO96_037023, partial [Rhipicephalus appendiculatus]